MVKVECPFGGCGFTGSVGSVEAHISGSTSGDHQGEVGRNHREYLTQQAERTISVGDLPENVGSSADSGSSNPGRSILVGTLVLAVAALATVADDPDLAEEIEENTASEEWVV